MIKAINSHNDWKTSDIKTILLVKPCQLPKRSKKNWRWLYSAKDAAAMLGRSVSSIKAQRVINYNDRSIL